MARIKMQLTEGMTGMIGNLVFRNVNGSIIVSSRPRKISKKKETALQKKTRDNFRRVAAQVKRKLLDPKVKEHYKREAKRLKLPNAYTAALKEGMKAKS